MLLPRDVLDHYVRRHNQGVRSRDFSALLEMFDDDARFELSGTKQGSFVGRAAIERAFSEHGPSDEIVILESREHGHRAIEADYAWKSRPASRAGKLSIEIDGGSIARLSVTAG